MHTSMYAQTNTTLTRPLVHLRTHKHEKAPVECLKSGKKKWLHHLFEIVNSMLKHRGNNQLVSSGFLCRVLCGVWAPEPARTDFDTPMQRVSPTGKGLRGVRTPEGPFTVPHQRDKIKSRLTHDRSHFHLGTDHLEKQWVNVNYHLCNFPP